MFVPKYSKGELKIPPFAIEIFFHIHKKTKLFNYRVNIIVTKGFRLTEGREQTALEGTGKPTNIASRPFMGLQTYRRGRINNVRNIRLFSKAL